MDSTISKVRVNATSLGNLLKKVLRNFRTQVLIESLDLELKTKEATHKGVTSRV